MGKLVMASVLVALLAGGCGNDDGDGGTAVEATTTSAEAPSVDDAAGESFAVTLDEVDAGGTVPEAHTCDGADTQPTLRASAAPDGTVAYALIVEDPDAPTPEPFVHWVAANIEPGDPLAVGGAVQGTNDQGRLGWGGPCPPPGDGPHEYAFHLYALDDTVEVAEGVTAAELRSAIDGHVLGQTQTSAYYER